MEPTTNTIKIPIVKNSWKHVPKRPRIEVSAYSEMNIGVTTHDPPVEIPTSVNNKIIILHFPVDLSILKAKYHNNDKDESTMTMMMMMIVWYYGLLRTRL